MAERFDPRKRPIRPVLRRTPELVLRRYEEIQRRRPERDVASWFEAYRASGIVKALPNGVAYVAVDHPEVHSQLGGFLDTKYKKEPIILISSRLNPVEQESLATKIHQEWLTQKTSREIEYKNNAIKIKSRYIELVKQLETQIMPLLKRCPKDGKRYSLKIGKFEFVVQYNSLKGQYEVSPRLNEIYTKLFASTNTSTVVFVYKE